MLRFLLCFVIGICVVLLPTIVFSAGVPQQNDHSQASEVDASLQSAAQVYLAKTVELGQQGIVVTGGVVSGNYALLNWEDGLYGAGGGQVLMMQQDNAWRIVRGVGGVITYQMLINYGVPAEDASRLGGQL